MLDTVTLLGPLGIIPLVHGTYQVTGDPADALKTDTLAQLLIFVLDIHNSTSIGFHIVLPCILLSLWASSSVKSTFNKYSNQYSIRRITGADFAVSVTGVAGPDRDDRGNEVGTVYLAVSSAQGTVVENRHYGSRPRQTIREMAAFTAFSLLLQHLEEKQPTE